MKKQKMLSIMGVTAVLALTMGTSVLAAEEFDAAYYAAQNPDVVAAVGNNPTALELHYNMFGIKEGRAANSLAAGQGVAGLDRFDAAYYAEQNPDVAAVYGTDILSLYTHYLNFGAAEGRASSREAEKKSSTGSKTAENPYARFINKGSTGRHHSKRSKSEEKATEKKSSLDNLSIYIVSADNGKRVEIGQRFSVRIDGIELADGHHYEGLMEEISNNLTDGSPMHDYTLDEPESDWWDIWVRDSAKEGDILKIKFTCIIKDGSGNVVAKKENIKEYTIYKPEDRNSGSSTSSAENSTILAAGPEQEINAVVTEDVKEETKEESGVTDKKNVQSDRLEDSEIKTDKKPEALSTPDHKGEETAE